MICKKTFLNLQVNVFMLQANTKNNFHFYRKSELKKTGGGQAPPELKCWERKVQQYY